MFRRDEYLDLLGELNSNEILQLKLKDLEKFVDDELRKNENIIKMINSTSATSKPLENGLEIVENIILTTIVHKDISVKTNNRISIGNNSDAVSYGIWEDDLLLANGNSAVITPWIDKAIAETAINSYNFNGKLRLQLPANTNKFLAKILADKYMSIGKKDNTGALISGFWSASNRVNDKNNTTNSNNVILSDAVRVLYDNINNIVYLEFKLF